MPEYRLYFLDSAGHIQRAIVLVCEGDRQAIARMGGEKHQHGLELWQAGRHVHRVGGEVRKPSA